VLGLLPCGFLYTALIAAAGTGGAAAGALSMGAFVLGTMPSLLAVSVVGSVALRRWRGIAAALAAPIFFVNAIVLGGIALQMIA
jgi:uncharacterized protein